MNEEFFAKHERSRIQCSVNALESVNKMDLPKLVVISDDSFSGLSFKASRSAYGLLERLGEEYGDKLPYLIGLSLRQTWFALLHDSGYEALMMAEGAMGDNDYMQKLATAKDYGENAGIAWTLYMTPEGRQPATFLDGTPFEECPSMGDILNGAAMYWFAAAATSYRAGDVDGAFDWLSEAHHAMSLVNGSRMWDEGAKLERESAIENSVSAATAARTALAKVAAQARHTENRATKASVFEWLDINMVNFREMEIAEIPLLRYCERSVAIHATVVCDHDRRASLAMTKRVCL